MASTRRTQTGAAFCCESICCCEYVALLWALACIQDLAAFPAVLKLQCSPSNSDRVAWADLTLQASDGISLMSWCC